MTTLSRYRRRSLYALPVVGVAVLLAVLVSRAAVHAKPADAPTTAQYYTLYEPFQPGSERYPEKGFDWENNNLGISDEVPAPWTPVSYDKGRLACWGREYVFTDGLLFDQVFSQGRPLLAANPRLELMVDGKTLSDRTATSTVTERAENHVRLLRTVEYADVSLRADILFEFDGFIRFDITLIPRKEVRIDRLIVRVPIRPDIATYYNRFLEYDYDEKKTDRYAVLSSFGPITTSAFKFRPTVWMGNEELGMEWITETNIDWHVADDTASMRFRETGEMTEFQARIIDAPVTAVPRPLQYSFAFLATPTKPMPKAWRSLLMCEYRAAGESAPIHARVPQFFVNNPDFDVYGRELFLDHRAALRYAGLPLPYPAGPKRERNRMIRAEMERFGIGYVPYGGETVVLKTHPAARAYADRWRMTDKLQGCWNWGRHAGLWSPEGPGKREKAGLLVDFNVKSVKDFLVGAQVEGIRQTDTDGVYFDLSTLKANGVQKLYANSGKSLERKQYFPVYGHRDFGKRVWMATKSVKPSFLITRHTPQTAAYHGTFTDVVLNGEVFNTIFRKRGAEVTAGKYGSAWRDQAKYNPDYFQLPSHLFAAGFSQALGHINMLLPQVIKRNNAFLREHPELSVEWTRRMLARTLVHDLPVWHKRADSETLLGILKVKHEFGIHKGNVRHLPMHRAAAQMGHAGETTLEFTAYALPGKMLLIAANRTAGDQHVSVRAPMEWYGSSDRLQRAWNAETGRDLEVDDNRIRVTVPARKFVMIRAALR